ncbi:Uncharacterised protein [Anaerotruncus sp. 2789STDY5834896]|uniref:Uncharacterized protein n=1 Tax=uncultured Anaerotruncus sp. TaxID=905011 RepID=A0A1C6JV09_9FIRM|nr:Uncharacterised protein [uncultured Anaerotruncus sp.]
MSPAFSWGSSILRSTSSPSTSSGSAAGQLSPSRTSRQPLLSVCGAGADSFIPGSCERAPTYASSHTSATATAV